MIIANYTGESFGGLFKYCFVSCYLSEHLLFVIVDDTRKDINLQLSSVEKLLVQINCLTSCGPIARTPPTSLRRVNYLELQSSPMSICYYKNHIYSYICSNNYKHVVRIDLKGNQYGLVSDSSCKSVKSIQAKTNKIFVIQDGNENSRICVYDLSGQLITSWQHTDSCRSYDYIGNKLAVIGYQVIVDDVSNKRLTVYSPTGDIMRHIPCTQLVWCSSICEAGDDSVIITYYLEDKVYKLSLTTGQIEWTSTDVRSPAAVVCYAYQYVLVAANYSSAITLLDINTGKKCFMMVFYSFILKNYGFCCRNRYRYCNFSLYASTCTCIYACWLISDFSYYLFWTFSNYRKFVGSAQPIMKRYFCTNINDVATYTSNTPLFH